MELHFYNVQLLNFIGLYVMNSMKLKAVNVKEARFWNSTFAHIPVGGFEVSRAKLLNIKVSKTESLNWSQSVFLHFSMHGLRKGGVVQGALQNIQRTILAQTTPLICKETAWLIGERAGLLSTQIPCIF